ncbi:MAG: hypothetical protein WC451_06615 [Patescibacteria group bacterium]
MYKLLSDGYVQNNNICIPNDPANKDWQEYQAWLAKGNKPLPIDPVAEPTEAQLYEAQIKVKEAEILRRQAIAELTVEVEQLAK